MSFIKKHAPFLAKPYIKIPLRIVGVILALVFILWIAIVAFVHYNKEFFVTIITGQINDNMSGSVSIKKIEPTLLQGFPDISFELKDVTVRDSLWDIHHRDLVKLESAYVSIGLWDALRKEAFIKKLTLTNGAITLYTDENEITNSKIFRKKDKKAKSTNNPLNDIELINVVLDIKHKVKNKDFVLNFQNANIQLTHNDTGWSGLVHVKSDIRSFAFNTDKGSFIKDKQLLADLRMSYSNDKKQLTLPVQNILLSDDMFRIGGDFFFADTPYTFQLRIFGKDVAYNTILQTLTPPIRSKIADIGLERVDEVQVDIIGKMKYRDTPYVKADFVVNNRPLTLPQGTITNCSFRGFFLDERIKGAGHGDENSMIYVEQLTGNYYGIDFRAQQTSVTNLKDPILRTNLTSDIKLAKLNDAIGTNTFKFNGGSAEISMNCVMGLKADANIPPDINGNIVIKNAGFTYTPRNLSFTNTTGEIVFKHADVSIKDFTLNNGGNKLVLNGTILNLLNLYYTAPEKVVIDASLRSKKLDLTNYVSLLGKRGGNTGTTVRNNNAPNSLRKFSQQLDALMDQSMVNLDLKLDEVNFRRFRASDIKAGIVLSKSQIQLKNVLLKHADGNIKVNATVQPQAKVNTFTVNADLDHVNVKKLFYSFNNFGQTAIQDENIEGSVSAKINAGGGIQYSGDIVPRSLNGKIEFTLNNGRLIDFEPFGAIAKLIFFNRDLSDIKIEPLQGTFDVDRGKITIKPMLIQTSVINVFTEGVYGIPTGTDILIQIPLRNPKKDLTKENEKMVEKDLKKGMVINLRATDDNTGNVKIKLGKKKKDN